MSVAINLKVNDGLVLAADSASTLFAGRPGAQVEQAVVNVYNNANKVFNLVKGLPIGMLTWGAGSIGNASIATLAKDLRKRLSEETVEWKDWELCPESYTIEAVAHKVKEFMFDEMYASAFEDTDKKPPIGFLVAGYSAGELMAEEYQIDILQGDCSEPCPTRPKDETGISWHGETEAIARLILGHSMKLPLVLRENLEVPEEQIAPTMSILERRLQAPLIHPAMPIQDAIDLAEFLVDLTIKFVQYLPSAPTVGGPIEVAAITKHEGFKWIRRKHYYDRELNPEAEQWKT